MGARRLREWLSQPLAARGTHPPPAGRRPDACWTTAAASTVSAQQLASVRDLERTIGRLSAGSGNARDLVGPAPGTGAIARR